MASKKEFTIEELTILREEAKKTYEDINEQLEKAIQEEEDRKKAELALEKENRKKEVDDALENFRTLVSEYVQDYGTYETITNTKNYPWSWWF